MEKIKNGVGPAEGPGTLGARATEILMFDHIEEEIRWPKVEGNRLVDGYVTAVLNTHQGVRKLELQISRIKHIYVFNGKLYVVYDDDKRKYEPFLTVLPPLAVEVDKDIYYEYVDNEGKCKIWRFSLRTVPEDYRLLQKLLGNMFEYDGFEDSRPNFTITPVNIKLYFMRITGVAVVEDPRFELSENEYKGIYIILTDDFGGYTLYRVYGIDIENLKRLLEQWLEISLR